MSDLEPLAQSLIRLGYHNLTSSNCHIDGIVYNIDLSNASRSQPEDSGTGPFATLDKPENHIPNDILNTCSKANADVTVLGNGGYSTNSHLHLHIE